MGKQLVDEDIISEEDDGMGKDGVIMVEGGGDNPVVEDRVSQDIDEKDFLLSDGEVEEVDGDLVGEGVMD